MYRGAVPQAEIPPVSLWEYREAMKTGRALGRTRSNELVLAELIRQQRQNEGENQQLIKAKRRSRERKGTLKGSIPADSTFERRRPVDTGDTSRDKKPSTGIRKSELPHKYALPIIHRIVPFNSSQG